MTSSREQFEEWIEPKYDMDIGSKDPDGDYYFEPVQLTWEGWQASRQCIEVEIASHSEFEIEHMISPEKDGYATGWIDGRNYAAKQVSEAGIKIKGA